MPTNFPHITTIPLDEGDFLEISQGCLTKSMIFMDVVAFDEDGEETHATVGVPITAAMQLSEVLKDLILKCIASIVDEDLRTEYEEALTKGFQHAPGNIDPPTPERNGNHLTLLHGGKRHNDFPQHTNPKPFHVQNPDPTAT